MYSPKTLKCIAKCQKSEHPKQLVWKSSTCACLARYSDGRSQFFFIAIGCDRSQFAMKQVVCAKIHCHESVFWGRYRACQCQLHTATVPPSTASIHRLHRRFFRYVHCSHTNFPLPAKAATPFYFCLSSSSAA